MNEGATLAAIEALRWDCFGDFVRVSSAITGVRDQREPVPHHSRRSRPRRLRAELLRRDGLAIGAGTRPPALLTSVDAT
jgi:hypothetical protein